MKRKMIAVLTGLALSASIQAQDHTVVAKPNAGIAVNDATHCYTVQYMEELYREKGIRNADASFESWMAQVILESKKNKTLGNIINYQVPVVFHIVHQGQFVGSGPNISQARIQSQLAQLNKDFANLGNSPYGVSSTTGISFYLAQNDPSGIPLVEPGIHRVNSTTDVPGLGDPPYSSSTVTSVLKPATIWDPTRYVNVWITQLSGSILGFATFPTGSGLDGLSSGESASNAGVVVNYSTIGSLISQTTDCSLSTANAGKTLVHEMGHYFGLRHIWGDGTCATDYVDDTPTHEKANYGNFVHPKPNNCGTADEMFENYMDYSADIMLNTFTTNQVDRMQIVMLNSPRRKELPTSNVGVVSFTSNKLGFLACNGASSWTEDGNTGSPIRYRDIKVALTVEDRASAAATVNLTTSGSATNGDDYTLLSNVVTFAAGEANKEITIRVYDDGLVEPNETVVITCSITGTGVTPGPLAAYTLTIVDNDNYVVAQKPVSLISENFDQTVTGWASYSNESSPLNGFVVGFGASGFTGRSAYISNNRTLGESSANEYTIDDPEGSLSILRMPLINAAGLTDLKLSYKWKCEGEKDADGTYDYGTIVSAPGSNGTSFNTVSGAPVMVQQPNLSIANFNFPAVFNNTSFYAGFYWINDDNTGTQPPLAIDEVIFTGQGKKIEETASSVGVQNVPAAAKVLFTSQQDNELIVTVDNASSTIGTLTATVTESGTGQANITAGYGTYKRSAKVIKLTPAVAFSGTVKVTLYFTENELAVWGGTAPQLKVMKVADGVSLSSPVNPGNAELLVPTVDNQLTARGYIAYTVDVTGFSQFFLVEAATVLPVQWVSFDARANVNAIDLQWQTANEVNSRGFDVERSTDGNNYSSMGFVASKAGLGNSGNNTYQYTDAKALPGVLYYYRIRQQDRDGSFSYSAVRSASIAANGNWTVYPNPASGKIRLASTRNIEGSIQLLGPNGQLLKTWPRQLIPAGGVALTLPNLPAGIYILQLVEESAVSMKRITIR